MKNISFIIVSALFLFAGCSSKALKPREVDQYYTSTGVQKYFLSDIPDWANFSQSAGCFRSKGIRYFDIEAMMKSFSLNYNQALQIQASYNEEFLVMKKNPKVNLTLKDEEVLYFKASDRVNSKINFFDAPTFKEIHLIWLDEALLGKKQEERLRAFLQSSVHDTGVPVLVSACLTKEEAEAKFPNLALKVISAELFSIYDTNGVRQPSLHVNVNAFFQEGQKLIFYKQDIKKNADDIRGIFKTSNY
ncbi:hypothetical protein DOM21_15945 [Bacteriovorax stolpii]|uniref:Uncharacterized protein n=1 Tax=Bacteriovorax stolpii TaxID=960 RepID=A0A2K9NQ15_BACTC|nr:hypothetical protein [Bacteriovorax stolpii]AUN97145.1 hypothetical protein C0V70_03280 [Bacteriovorax stolpii]QDK42916.1 hypothetical protein DOM21_15945 [Bacteriovorax stolpii]TDP53431.1 hypothetical protein C8D79_2075 [Bacteriovorax stolpii]